MIFSSSLSRSVKEEVTINALKDVVMHYNNALALFFEE
jgi:hypothetical protein